MLKAYFTTVGAAHACRERSGSQRGQHAMQYNRIKMYGKVEPG